MGLILRSNASLEPPLPDSTGIAVMCVSKELKAVALENSCGSIVLLQRERLERYLWCMPSRNCNQGGHRSRSVAPAFVLFERKVGDLHAVVLRGAYKCATTHSMTRIDGYVTNPRLDKSDSAIEVRSRDTIGNEGIRQV